MNLRIDVDTLAKVPTFSGLSDDQLRLLGFSSERVELGSGDTLFRRGDAAVSGFVVTSGAINLSAAAGAPPCGQCGPGCLIGELPLFVDTTWKTDAVAAEPTRLIVIPRKVMRRMLDEYPELASALHARMSAKLTNTITELRGLKESLLRPR